MSISTLTESTVANADDVAALGPVYFDLVSFHGDTSYPTGGTPGFQALVRSTLGDNRSVVAVVPQDCGGYTPAYDAVNDKLKVWAANNTEVANTTDLSGVTFFVLVISH